jgi:hypothetical protein
MILVLGLKMTKKVTGVFFNENPIDFQHVLIPWDELPSYQSPMWLVQANRHWLLTSSVQLNESQFSYADHLMVISPASSKVLLRLGKCDDLSVIIPYAWMYFRGAEVTKFHGCCPQLMYCAPSSVRVLSLAQRKYCFVFCVSFPGDRHNVDVLYVYLCFGHSQ